MAVPNKPTPKRDRGFPPEQSKFIELFVQYVGHERMERIDAAIKAATEVGYAQPKTMANRLFSHATYYHVRDEINRRLALIQAVKSSEQEITAERIVKELGQIAFNNPQSMEDADGNLKDLKDMDDATARSMQVVGIREVVIMGKDGKRKVVRKLEVKPYNKLRALDQLALCLGLQTGKGANQSKTQVNVSWAEIFGPAAAPQGNGNALDNPDELEKRIQAEEAKALPEHKEEIEKLKGGTLISGRNGQHKSNVDDEYV